MLNKLEFLKVNSYDEFIEVRDAMHKKYKNITEDETMYLGKGNLIDYFSSNPLHKIFLYIDKNDTYIVLGYSTDMKSINEIEILKNVTAKSFHIQQKRKLYKRLLTTTI